MAIRYSLHKNRLTAGDEDYAARVHPVRTVPLGGVVERIHDRGSSLTIADINGVLTLLVDVCSQIVAAGSSVILDGFVELSPTIRGAFNGCEDGFDRSRHTITVNATATAAFKTKVALDAGVEKNEAGDPSPSVTMVYDLASESIDTTLTSGNIAEIAGYRLKFDPAREDEGVFLIAADGSDTHRIAFVHHNKPRKLIVLVPAGLASSSYLLEVRTRSSPNGDLRVGRLARALSYT